jgi:hypothetical protein
MWGSFREMKHYITFSDLAGEIFLILVFLAVALGIIIAQRFKK